MLKTDQAEYDAKKAKLEEDIQLLADGLKKLDIDKKALEEQKAECE